MYYYQYPRPAVTATILPIITNYSNLLKSEIIIGTRSDSASAFPGRKCLVGGFLNPKITQEDTDDISLIMPGETIEECALRELKEETNLSISMNTGQLFQYHICSDPDTDPRCHVVNICFYVDLYVNQLSMLKAGDDLKKVEILPIEAIYNNSLDLAFNHQSLAEIGLKKMV